MPEWLAKVRGGVRFAAIVAAVLGIGSTTAMGQRFEDLEVSPPPDQTSPSATGPSTADLQRQIDELQREVALLKARARVVELTHQLDEARRDQVRLEGSPRSPRYTNGELPRLPPLPDDEGEDLFIDLGEGSESGDGLTELPFAVGEDAPAIEPPLPNPDEVPFPDIDIPAFPQEILDEYRDRIKPLPPAPIPDDPPPHEGAMYDLPFVIEPPDLIVVEVLEALPGRPISGERLVRPDGTISLGFYGDFHVAGLTLEQAKIKIILHLKKYLGDEELGLVSVDYDEESGEPAAVHLVRPEDSEMVFVDESAYNSMYYYVEGDVNAPGRLPWTGRETVLDVLRFAGGFAPTADRHDVKLHRAARGDQPAKTFEIDYDAIERGETAVNLQMFPGDRLIVGRDAIVRQTLAAERRSALLQAVLHSMRTQSSTEQDLVRGAPDLSPEERRALVERVVDATWAALGEPDAPAVDAEAIRELLLKGMPAAEGEPKEE